MERSHSFTDLFGPIRKVRPPSYTLKLRLQRLLDSCCALSQFTLAPCFESEQSDAALGRTFHWQPYCSPVTAVSTASMALHAGVSLRRDFVVADGQLPGGHRLVARWLRRLRAGAAQLPSGRSAEGGCGGGDHCRSAAAPIR